VGSSLPVLAVWLPIAARRAAARPTAPPDTMPGTAQVFVVCAVTAAGLSSQCRFYTAVVGPTERLKAGTELGYLDAHPFPIPGAQAGATVKVLVRMTVSPAANGQGFAVGAPEAVAPSHAGAEIGRPAWIAPPRGLWADALTSELARRQNQEGQATAHCTATAAGTLTECWVETESPPNLGFGEAALVMLQHARMKPMAGNGAPVAGRSYVQTFQFSPNAPYTPMMPSLPPGSMSMHMGMAMGDMPH